VQLAKRSSRFDQIVMRTPALERQQAEQGAQRTLGAAVQAALGQRQHRREVVVVHERPGRKPDPASPSTGFHYARISRMHAMTPTALMTTKPPSEPASLSHDVTQMRYNHPMKTATIPSVRVEPEFRAEVEAVLADGESLSEFVEASVRASVERRRIHTEFMARGLRSRDDARATGDYVDADVVLKGLQRKLDAARVRVAKTRK
jgi:hypothetical protein